MSTTSRSELEGAPEFTPLGARELEPAAALDPEPEDAPEATQAEDDWDEIKADIKHLVMALRSLAPQPEPVIPRVSLVLQARF
jgi:hypothetical protein